MSFEYQNYYFNKHMNLYKGKFELMEWQRYLDMSGDLEPRGLLFRCYICGEPSGQVITKVFEGKANGYLQCCSEECFNLWLLR